MPPAKSIRIGPFDYTLGTLPKDKAARQLGECTPADLTILLAKSFASPVQHAETLLHEILHAVFATMALDAKKDGEERIVECMAVGLAMVMRDNPALFKWITGKLK